jgi:hypothetical protein
LVRVTKPGVVRLGRVGDTPEAIAVGEAVGVSVSVGVGTYCEMTSTVRAAIVLILPRAELTMLCGLISDTLGA